MAHADRENQAQLEAIRELTQQFGEVGTNFWLAGGWGVDFHLGRISRPHSDIDIVARAQDASLITDLLLSAGYSLRPSEDPKAELLFERGDLLLDVTFITESDDGSILTPGWEHWPWQAGAFPETRQHLEGISARVVSASNLLESKESWAHRTGESRRDRDTHDLEALRTIVQSVDP